MSTPAHVAELIAAGRALAAAMERMRFASPVAYVYDPLLYAWGMYEAYLRRYAKRGVALFLGMNPGPFGMAQTGIPFGEVATVRDWLALDEPIGRPEHEHPKRPVRGLACAQSEVSGRRLWGLFRERFGTPERFFAGHFVANWCPLAFMAGSGANITPDKLPAAERAPLEAACDEHLRRTAHALDAATVVGVGAFAAKRAQLALGGGVRVTTILHPSPASPAANHGWAQKATAQLEAAGVWTAKR